MAEKKYLIMTRFVDPNERGTTAPMWGEGAIEYTSLKQTTEYAANLNKLQHGIVYWVEEVRQ